MSKYTELDDYILNIVHELLYGSFERTGDGKDHVLSNYWYPNYQNRVHEIVDKILQDDDQTAESDQEKTEKEKEQKNVEKD